MLSRNRFSLKPDEFTVGIEVCAHDTASHMISDGSVAAGDEIIVNDAQLAPDAIITNDTAIGYLSANVTKN